MMRYLPGSRQHQPRRRVRRELSVDQWRARQTSARRPAAQSACLPALSTQHNPSSPRAKASASRGMSSHSMLSPVNSIRLRRSSSACWKNDNVESALSSCFSTVSDSHSGGYRQPGVGRGGETERRSVAAPRNRNAASVAAADGVPGTFPRRIAQRLIGQLDIRQSQFLPVVKEYRARQGEGQHRHRAGPVQTDARRRRSGWVP